MSNDWALAYTGGTAGKADPSKSPVVIGYVNEQGGVPAFPEATQGLDAAVKYVNGELGGIQGHPIKIESCFVIANEDGQKCGTQSRQRRERQARHHRAHDRREPGALQHRRAEEAGHGRQPGRDARLRHRGHLRLHAGWTGRGAGHGGVRREAPEGIHKVSVVYGDSEAEVFGAESLLVPKLKSYGITDVTLQKISDTPTAPDVQNALTAAGAGSADLVIPIVTVQGCIATYDALKSLGIKTPVVTTGLCFGTPMTKHLADLGSSDTVPDGWYFGDYGYSYFVPDKASGMTTYLARSSSTGRPTSSTPGSPVRPSRT